MKKKNVFVLGYFGYETNQLDGQTVKTRNIYELLKNRKQEIDFDLSYFDTQIFQSNKVSVLKMFAKIWNSDILFYIAAHNNLKYFFPIVYVISKLRKVHIHYVVVGGWLAEFIETKPLHIKMLRHIKGIYPQTHDLTEELKIKYKFRNVFQLNNFRMNSNSMEITNQKVNKDNSLKLVFMARIHPMKGVDVLFIIADKLKSLSINDVRIDIYGPIYEEYKKEFEEKLKSHNLVFYKGIIQPINIQSVLKKYDLMLFPTKYYTEGFPGSILDAYISGIPVIATCWKYANEFIEHNVCGIITKFNDDDNFVNSTIMLIKSPGTIDLFKRNAIKQAQKYSGDSAWSILKENMFS